MRMPNLPYLWLAANLKLRPNSTAPHATFAGVRFAVKPEHYQLRGVLKQQAIQPVLAQLLSLCDGHTLFVDIGANVGLFSLLVASETGAQVLALEPVRSTFHALVRNCSLNPALPINPLNVAMGAAPHFVEITAVPGSGINQVASVAERQGEPRQPAIQLSLDQLCLQELAQGFQKIVIKIDVERYEFEVVAGMQKFLESNVPIALCVEVDPVESSKLSQLLSSAQFSPFETEIDLNLLVSNECDPSNLFYRNSQWAAL